MLCAEAFILAYNLMHQHGLNDWKFKFDRALTRHGQCNYSKKTISLSEPLTKLKEEAAVKDTLLHEIAHALVGPGHHHDYVWQMKAIQIGAKGNRCSPITVKPPAPYVANCCGQTYQMYRMRRLTPGRYHACRLCKGRIMWTNG